MADEDDSALRVCKKCFSHKPIDSFPTHAGFRTHSCRECVNAHRRARYEAREGQYASVGTPEHVAKRQLEYRNRRDHEGPPLDSIRACNQCGEVKTVGEFGKVAGGRSAKCRLCDSVNRRKKYAARVGQYAKRDRPEEKQKRRESARKLKGRYVWTSDWLNVRNAKSCAKCKIELPANPAWFRPDTKNTTGLASWCRACEARSYDENKQKRNEAQRAYHARRMITSPEAIRANRLAWQRQNKDKKIAFEQRWKDENTERYKAIKVAAQNKRRALVASASGSFNANDIERMRDSQKGRCWYCLKHTKKFHVEHRIPLSKGGSNGPENLVLSCAPCNLKKGVKMPWEMENPRLI